MEKIKSFIEPYKKTKKVLGAIFVIVGILALITPFTPGSWLAFVGLELLGIRFLLLDKFKLAFKKQKS
jgi:hypothetical protein